MATTTNFRVEVATEADLPDLAALIHQIFGHYDLSRELGNVPTPEGIAAAVPRYEKVLRDHVNETGEAPFIKCLAPDPTTGKETLAACAMWFLFPHPRSKENFGKRNYLISAEWLPEGDPVREKVYQRFTAMSAARDKWSRGRGIGFFMYMATRDGFRRKGAATLCTRWGMDRCAELGIPAYLEASDEGKLVYEKLGFEVIEWLQRPDGPDYPAMIWWPSSISEADRKPLPPQD